MKQGRLAVSHKEKRKRELGQQNKGKNFVVRVWGWWQGGSVCVVKPVGWLVEVGGSDKIQWYQQPYAHRRRKNGCSGSMACILALISL